MGKCAPGENYHGLWEVPLYQAQIGGELYGVGSEWGGGRRRWWRGRGAPPCTPAAAALLVTAGWAPPCPACGPGAQPSGTRWPPTGPQLGMSHSLLASCLPPALPSPPADYASEEALMPPIPTDMESFLKDLLDERLANSKAPLSISTIYGW